MKIVCFLVNFLHIGWKKPTDSAGSLITHSSIQSILLSFSWYNGFPLGHRCQGGSMLVFASGYLSSNPSGVVFFKLCASDLRGPMVGSYVVRHTWEPTWMSSNRLVLASGTGLYWIIEFDKYDMISSLIILWYPLTLWHALQHNTKKTYSCIFHPNNWFIQNWGGQNLINI